MLHEFSTFVLVFIFILLSAFFIFSMVVIGIPLISFWSKGENPIKLFLFVSLAKKEAKENNFGDDASITSIEFEYGHKKYRFSNFNEAYNYIEQLGNEALESYDKLKYLNDYDKDFLELKGKLEKITYAIRKYRWQNQK